MRDERNTPTCRNRAAHLATLAQRAGIHVSHLEVRGMEMPNPPGELGEAS